MPNFSIMSQRRLSSCDPRLQDILNEAIKQIDFTVLCGRRNQADQEDALRRGHTKLPFPKSKHNGDPSKAVDIAPYPINWKDTARFARLAGYIERIAFERGTHLRWGGDWDQDFETADERFVDMPHLEIVE